jgi:hypothetical protein
VATALSTEAFDAAAMERALDVPLEDVSRGRSVLVSAMAKIHEALDVDQRRRLARLVETLPPGHAF